MWHSPELSYHVFHTSMANLQKPAGHINQWLHFCKSCETYKQSFYDIAFFVRSNLTRGVLDYSWKTIKVFIGSVQVITDRHAFTKPKCEQNNNTNISDDRLSKAAMAEISVSPPDRDTSANCSVLLHDLCPSSQCLGPAQHMVTSAGLRNSWAEDIWLAVRQHS